MGPGPVARLASPGVVTSRVLEAVFAELDAHRVVFEGMLLKPNMVISGKKCAQQATAPMRPDEMSARYLECLGRRAERLAGTP